MNSWRQGWMGRLATGCLLVVGACTGPQGGPGDGEQNAPGELIRSDVPRVDKPDVGVTDLASVAAGNTDFGAALYRELREPEKNLFFSPYSLTQALSMTYAGARGETERQMGQGLHVSLTPERFHPAMNALNQKLFAPSTYTGSGTAPRVHGVNAPWAQKGFAFESGYLDLLARHYGAGVRVVDFARDPSGVREGINGWVAEQTEDRIKDLLPPSAVNSGTRLVLVNALHFKGAWATPFAPKGTQDAPFHLLDGRTRPVPMMSGGGSARHMKGGDFEALALDYVGSEFRLLMVIPDAGRFEALETRLSAGFLDEVRGALTPRYLDVHLPRFELETTASLAPTLQKLGIKDLFTSSANLTGLSRSESLVVSSVEHKAFVSVNEQGTEAAAATAVVLGPPSVPQPYFVDRPFLFLIEHVETRTVLFLGRYVTP